MEPGWWVSCDDYALLHNVYYICACVVRAVQIVDAESYVYYICNLLIVLTPLHCVRKNGIRSSWARLLCANGGAAPVRLTEPFKLTSKERMLRLQPVNA